MFPYQVVVVHFIIFQVPEALTAFGVHTKKKTHALYGDHFKEGVPMAAATKIKFDD
jgi:hypothetical protein